MEKSFGEERDGEREENAWGHAPFFFRNVFPPFPKSFMSSACPVPFAPEQADNLLRSRAAALRADDERREGDDGRGHDGVGLRMLRAKKQATPATMEATAPETLASFQ